MTYRFEVRWETKMDHSTRRKRERWEVSDAADDRDAMRTVIDAIREEAPWWSDGRFEVRRVA